MSILLLTLLAPPPLYAHLHLLGGNYNIHDNDLNESVEADYRLQYIIFRAN